MVNVIVRVLPDNEDIDVSLPLTATATDVIEKLLENGIGSKTDASGNPISYQLAPKGKGRNINPEETLEAAQVQEGDVIMMTPIFVAGN
ncbi:EsaB/YukD family protein [Lewinella sp. W8]|uniref:EsaB/YukD family protein n=1 Tax=Lewinella sp. W8 TaxID=2528208 RepID=UPI0010677FA5|nr:EsaB/YukD family protein [Lewinella sp. W8]MTB52930.1 hypothetical protein [Lewinella sp. W8]